MLRKLYSLVSGTTCADNPDSPQHHEVLLPGFLYGMIIKERFDDCLAAVKLQIQQDIRQNKAKSFQDRTCYLLPKIIRLKRYREVFPVGIGKDELGRRHEAIALPCDGESGLADGTGSATDIRIHDSCGEAQLLPVSQPFQVYTSRSVLCGAEDDECAKALTRIMG